jgi:hypothetical protein
VSESSDDKGDDDAKPVLSNRTPAVRGELRWATVCKGGNTVEANLLVTKLQAHGIHARVDMENAAGLGPYGGVVYGTKVQVLSGDAAAARAIVDDIEANRARRMAAESVSCPRCGQQNAKRVLHPMRWWGMALIAVPFVLMPFGEMVSDHVSPGWLFMTVVLGIVMLVWWGVTPRWLCKSCGMRFAAKEPEPVDDDEEDGDSEPD